jgi:hypothetical protein
MQQEVQQEVQQETNKERQLRRLKGLGFGNSDKWEGPLERLATMEDGTYKEPFQTFVRNRPVFGEVTFNVKDHEPYLENYQISILNINIAHKQINGVDTRELEETMRATDLSKFLVSEEILKDLPADLAGTANQQIKILQGLNAIRSNPEGNKIAEQLVVRYFDKTEFASQVKNFDQLRKPYLLTNGFPANYYESYHLRQASNMLLYNAWVRINLIPQEDRPSKVKGADKDVDQQATKDEVAEKKQPRVATTPEEAVEKRSTAWVKLGTQRSEISGNLYRVYEHVQTQEQIRQNGYSFDPAALLGNKAFHQTANQKDLEDLDWRLSQGDAVVLTWTSDEGKQMSARVIANAENSTYQLSNKNVFLSHDIVPNRQELDLGNILPAFLAPANQPVVNQANGLPEHDDSKNGNKKNGAIIDQGGAAAGQKKGTKKPAKDISMKAK